MLFPGGHSWKWSRRQVIHDPEVLQGHLHQGLQEDDRGRLSGETHQVIIISHLYEKVGMLIIRCACNTGR